MSVVGYNAGNGTQIAATTAIAAYEVARAASKYAPTLESPQARDMWQKVASLSSSASWKAACIAGTLGLIHAFSPADEKLLNQLPRVLAPMVLNSLPDRQILKFLRVYPNNPDVQTAAQLPLMRHALCQTAKDRLRIIKAKKFLKALPGQMAKGVIPGMMGALGGAKAVGLVSAAGASAATDGFFTDPGLAAIPLLPRLLEAISVVPIYAGIAIPQRKEIEIMPFLTLGTKLGIYLATKSALLRPDTEAHAFYKTPEGQDYVIEIMPFLTLVTKLGIYLATKSALLRPDTEAHAFYKTPEGQAYVKELMLKEAFPIIIPCVLCVLATINLLNLIRLIGPAVAIGTQIGRYYLIRSVAVSAIQSQIGVEFGSTKVNDTIAGALAGALTSAVGASFLSPTSPLPHHHSLSFASMVAGALAARLFRGN